MTTAALATLVDAGKLKWDDRVADLIPGFQMYDPWVTREMTVRDLLVHRSGLGLGAGDLLVIPRGTLSRAEVVKRLRFIKPATSFRSGYAYDNILYIVAGHVIDLVSGQPYEDYVREHVFKPAGHAPLHQRRGASFCHRQPRLSARAHRRRGSRHRAAAAARRARQSRAVLDTRRVCSPSAPTISRDGCRSSSREGNCPTAGGSSARNRAPRCGLRRRSSPSGPRCPASKR